MMNKILFDLNEVGLSLDDFLFLIRNLLEERVAVNGYTIRWCYDVNDGIVELTASFVRV